MVQLVVPIVISAFWLVIGFVLPFFVPKGENRGIIQTMLITTAVSCYLIWLVTYLAQFQPLFGPLMNNVTMGLMLKQHFSTQ